MAIASTEPTERRHLPCGLRVCDAQAIVFSGVKTVTHIDPLSDGWQQLLGQSEGSPK